MKKTYWVFWTYQANYGDHPIRVEAENFIEAAKTALPYDLYNPAKRIRVLIFQEGGTMVWDGYLPFIGDAVGDVVRRDQIEGEIIRNACLESVATVFDDMADMQFVVPWHCSHVKWLMVVSENVSGIERRKAYAHTSIPINEDLVLRVA